MKKILIYLGDHQEKEPILQTILQESGIAYRFLQELDLCQTIGYLLEEPGFTRCEIANLSHIASDLMFLDDISDEEIFELNARMKAQGISMPRKAMRTVHNETWRLQDLLKEIEQEHQYFQTLEEIQKLLMSSKDLVIDVYTTESWKTYEAAFYQAYEILQKQAEPDQANQALMALRNVKEGLVIKNSFSS